MMRPERDAIFYDGRCGLCRRSAALLRRLDWFGRLEFHDLARESPEPGPPDPEGWLEGLPMRTRHGALIIGFRALRRALLQTPLGGLPACLLYAPGASHAGRALYRRLAARRARALACRLERRDESERAYG